MHPVTDTEEATSPGTPPHRRGWGAWFEPGEPHPVRGPFTRWPHLSDSALAIAVFVASLVSVAVSALDDDDELTFASIVDRSPGVFIVLGLAAAALLWRRRHPLAITAFVLVLMIGWAIAGYGDGQELALLVAAYGVGRYTDDHRLSLATVVVIVAVSILGTLVDPNQRVDIAPAILLTGLPWYVGRRVRNRGDYLALLQERAERLEAEQHARARQAVVDERSRIARELHDVVAHRVSMMTVQAGAAKTIARVDLDAAVGAMGDVERAGRQALGELRHLLGVLRPETDGSDHLGPQPGLADVSTLADQLTRTGADVTMTIADLPNDLPATVDLSAYRIVQESFTNIVKHAGPNPTVRLTIGVDGGKLTIEVANTTDRARAAGGGQPELPGSGYGLAGMRERVNLLGGALSTVADPPGHYRVLATLPLEPESP